MNNRPSFWLAKWHRHDDRMSAYDRTTASPPSLYAPTWEDTISAVLRAEIGRSLGIKLEARLEQVPEVEEALAAGDAVPDPWCPCGSFDLRVFSGESGWECEACQRPFSDVWGCLNCTRVVCDDCLKTRSRDRDYYEHTLEEIGRLYGCHRERVRQIQEQALRKIRYARRSNCLEPWSTNDLTPREKAQGDRVRFVERVSRSA